MGGWRPGTPNSVGDRKSGVGFCEEVTEATAAVAADGYRMPLVSNVWNSSNGVVDIMVWLPVCLCVLSIWISWIPCAEASNTFRIFWNASNPMFHTSNNDHVIDVNLGDSIDIICPHYTDTSKSWEYYIVYMVDKRDYDMCVINDTSQKMKILNCSKPNSTNPHIYTLLVLDFQPIQGNPDFHEGMSYYFISTSGGQEKELDNQYQGACFEHKMKMILRVIPRDKTKPNTTRAPSSTPKDIYTPRTTTTTSTSTTTTTRTTPSTKPTTTSPRTKTTARPGGDGYPNENIIHVGGGGDKNEGTITDSAAVALRSPSLPLLLLVPGLCAAVRILR